MIFQQCANAADKGLPPEAHCTTPGCSCGHRAPTRTKETDIPAGSGQ